ncbi:MAG: RNA-binding protein [Candidatus Aenigmarchaeota archaeon]|nr:RNA-binding protein [Candidatus Aenigmarchaeota archaeon]
MIMKCISCHKNLLSEDDFTKFSCPSCGGEEILRCANCRVKGVLYQCTKCDFEGP